MVSRSKIGVAAGAGLGLCLLGTLAFAQNAVEQRWPTDDPPDWLLSYAPQKQTQDPFAGTTIKQPPGGLPAESGVNYTLTPYGGYLNAGSGAGSRGVGGASGTVAFPVGHSFGLISGVGAGTWGGNSYYGGGSMFYWRDPSVGLLGISGGGGHLNAFGGASLAKSSFGGEAYLGRFTPFVTGGVFTTNLTKPVGTASAGLAYYPIDNLQLSAGFYDIGGLAGASGGIEYLLPRSVAGVPTTLVLKGFAGNHALSGATAGLRFMIGPTTADKTLIRRRREDDPTLEESALEDVTNIEGGESAFLVDLALHLASRGEGTTLPGKCYDGENPSDGCFCPPGDVFGPPGPAQQCSLPSDVGLKRDIVKLGELTNGIGLYRYRYLDSDQFYVGVMAQEVAAFMPEAVGLMPDGYHLRVIYARLGMRLMTWEEWLSGHADARPLSGAGASTPSLNDEVIGAACGRTIAAASEPRPSLTLRRLAAQLSLKRRNCSKAI